MKNSLEGFKTRFTQKKESVILKIGHWRFRKSEEQKGE